MCREGHGHERHRDQLSASHSTNPRLFDAPCTRNTNDVTAAELSRGTAVFGRISQGGDTELQEFQGLLLSLCHQPAVICFLFPLAFAPLVMWVAGRPLQVCSKGPGVGRLHFSCAPWVYSSLHQCRTTYNFTFSSFFHHLAAVHFVLPSLQYLHEQCFFYII